MAINYAQKYSAKVVERYGIKSLTDKGLNKDYDWNGVKTLSVYSIPTVAMGDYTRSGSARYGTPTELEDTVQELTVTKDRAFSITIDKGNNSEQMGVKEAGKVLARQIDEVITPEIDKYRLSVWGATTNTTGSAAELTKATVYEKFLAAQEKLDEALVPETGRILYVKPSVLNLLKQDSNFIQASDVAQNMLIKGQVGEVDGVAIVKVPSSYFPSNCEFILIHPSCSCSPMKLEEYKTHDNPPGINGKLIEGRVLYDCFVFETKKGAICKHMKA